MSCRVLLTGATGFIGKQVLEVLKLKQINTTLIVRPNWEEKIAKHERIINVIETEDLFKETPEWWTNASKNIDVIIHLAWYAETGKYLMSDKNIDCLLGTLNLVRGASVAGIGKFIGVGTCFEYDLGADVLTTNTPLKPLSQYAAAKVATYFVLSHFLLQKNIEFTWCRLFYLYGENQDSRRLVSYIRSSIKKGDFVELTSGRQIRDYMDVRDAGIKIVEASIGDVVGAINICTGVPITVRKLAENIADEYDRRDLLKFGARKNNFTDPESVIGEPSI